MEQQIDSAETSFDIWWRSTTTPPTGPEESVVTDTTVSVEGSN